MSGDATDPTSFDDVLAAIGGDLPAAAGALTTAQHLDHCAASIVASLDGYPALKPWIVRATIGALVKRRFLAARRMKHDTTAPLPSLLKRVSSAIERELTQIEVIVCGSHVLPRQRTEAERRARTLASLARTLREVMQLRDREEKSREDDDTVPRDIDELRRQLAQRLDELVAGAKAVHPGEAE